jgi:hypothetical protein
MKHINPPAPTSSPRIRISPAFLLLLPLLLLLSPSLWAYPVPDTGQTESYTTTFGEDSDYLINPPSYTKLGASGNDLPDSATEWFMVRDNVTGLIWEVKQNQDDVPNYGDHHDADNTYTWYDGNPDTNGGNAGTPGDGTDTEDFVNALNAQWYGGHNDWRLPTIRELATVANLGTFDPAVDTTYFPNTVSSYYWSSTTNAYKTGDAWLIYFYNGGGYYHYKSSAYYVRAVRGGQTGSLGHLVINGDGTVSDAFTGLMWQQTGTESEMTWEAAVSYGEGLSLAGYADWRLPNLKELRSIVDYSVYSPATDATSFPNTVSSYYWSSTTYAYKTGDAWLIYFYLGYGNRSNKSNAYYVRAVRGGQARSLGHLVISSPVQGSIWNAGSIMPIRWDTAGISGNVKISISSQGGKTGTFQSIIESTPNNGSYDWTVDAGTSVNYALRVEPLSDSAKGTTQSLFTINNFSRKAIIVAGGGDYETNTLWDATRLCASYAYTALNVQGYGKSNLYYLSSERDLDLDNDGVSEVSGDATNADLEYAIKTWAADGDNLMVYLVGHGGDGAFRMGENELLNASDLDRWLDDVQKTLPGFVVVLYDACSSGSFVPALTPVAGKERVVAASAAADEEAVFQGDGGLSFGYQFFSFLFGGGSFYESFVHGKKSIEGTLGGRQNPQLEGNGDGVGNQKGDRQIAESIKLGDENKTANDIPVIGSISPTKVLSEGETGAVIYVDGVLDANGIGEVFAVIRPPAGGTPGEPVMDLPTVIFSSLGDGRYEGSYHDFTAPGSYNIAVFARDSKGALSLPRQTTVTKEGGCLTVNADLSIDVPCVDYKGSIYGFTLKYYDKPNDDGLYWRLDNDTLATGTGSDCMAVGADLSIPLSCAEYGGKQYGFTLLFHSPTSDDPPGLYWQLDMSTLVGK